MSRVKTSFECTPNGEIVNEGIRCLQARHTHSNEVISSFRFVRSGLLSARLKINESHVGHEEGVGERESEQRGKRDEIIEIISAKRQFKNLWATEDEIENSQRRRRRWIIKMSYLWIFLINNSLSLPLDSPPKRKRCAPPVYNDWK